MRQNVLRKKIVIHTPKLDFKIGGVVALHCLAKELLENNYSVMLYTIGRERYDNIFCNYFAEITDIDDSTIVIYPEVIEGNPLKAKNVVRWILCELGVNCHKDIFKTWGKNDLVFHYSTFNTDVKFNDISKLFVVWIDPNIKNLNQPRRGSCYLFRKASGFHKNLRLIHPKNSILIDNMEAEEIVRIFNSKKYFYSYDPYSFYESIAALCGCIPIVYPLEGVSKLDWLRTKSKFLPYLQTHDNFPGIAYGVNDIPYARESIKDTSIAHEAVIKYGKDTVVQFIDVVNSYFFQKNFLNITNTVAKVSDALGWIDKKKNMLEIENLKLNKEIELLNEKILALGNDVDFEQELFLSTATKAEMLDKMQECKNNIRLLESNISEITSSNFYTIWQIFCKIKKGFSKRD